MTAIVVGELPASDIERIRDIDRSERIDQLYRLHDGRLELIDVDIDALRWGDPGSAHTVEHYVDEWMRNVGEGVAGYVTPKSAIGAVVYDDQRRILLVQRADSGVWLYPTGWADVGYSPAEVAVKEVLEETGLEVRVDGVIGVFSRHFVGRAPGGVLEDYHGVHLIFRAVALDPAQTPQVTEVEGTTDEARWIVVEEVLNGEFPVSDVVRYGLSLPISDD